MTICRRVSYIVQSDIKPFSVSGNRTQMIDATPKSGRGFTLLELLLYITLFAVVLRITLLSDSDGTSGLLTLFGMCLLGALIGIGVSVWFAGRQFAIVGALFGGVILPLILFVLLALAASFYIRA
jgi:pilin/secretion family protein with methylation motif